MYSVVVWYWLIKFYNLEFLRIYNGLSLSQYEWIVIILGGMCQLTILLWVICVVVMLELVELVPIAVSHNPITQISLAFFKFKLSKSQFEMFVCPYWYTNVLIGKVGLDMFLLLFIESTIENDMTFYKRCFMLCQTSSMKNWIKAFRILYKRGKWWIRCLQRITPNWCIVSCIVSTLCTPHGGVYSECFITIRKSSSQISCSIYGLPSWV